LGVVAYELLTGRLPIGAFEAPSEVFRTLTRATDRAVLAALKRDPDHRPPNALDFARELERALGAGKRRSARIARGAIAAVSTVTPAGAAAGGLREYTLPKRPVTNVKVQSTGAAEPPAQAVQPVPSSTLDAEQAWAPSQEVEAVLEQMRVAREWAIEAATADP